MKLVVLGASGGCGQQLVELGKAAGHDVVAVVRSQTWQPPAGVSVLRGDLTDEAFLRQAFTGRDAVLSALGLRIGGLAPWNKPEQPDFLARSTPAIVAAMKATGVKRIVAISAGGVGDSRALMPGFFRAMIALTALKTAYAALDQMEQQLLGSGLEVLICRPSGLTDGPVTGQVKVVRGFKGRPTISRADVAAWMLEQVAGPASWADRTPMLTVTGAA